MKRITLFLKSKQAIYSFLFLAVAGYFIFGIYHISDFVLADEQYWKYERIPQYWDGILNGKLKKTHINDKPGVTLALISGIGLIFEKDPANHMVKTEDKFEAYDIQRTKPINLAFRLPILIFNGLFLLFLFWIISKILGSWIALWGVIFIGLSPPLLGISQIINPDALLWPFSAGALFSYLALLKYSEKKYLFLTAVLLGFSLLSKYSADILLPLFLFFMLIYPILEKNFSADLPSYFKKQIFNYFLIAIGALITISVFMPSVFLKPKHLYDFIIGFESNINLLLFLPAFSFLLFLEVFFLQGKFSKKIVLFFRKNAGLFHVIFPVLLLFFFWLIVGRNFISENKWTLFNDIPFYVEKINNFLQLYPEVKINFFNRMLLEFNSIVFSLTPIVIFFLIFLWIRSLLKKRPGEHYFYIFSFSCFILAYFLALERSDVLSTARYSIMIYPIAGTLAAIGAFQLSQLFKNLKTKYILTAIILLFSLGELFFSSPFYFNYTNFLLPKKYALFHAWGFGGYEAAQFINSQPNSQDLVVWSDYYGVCPFIKGRCLTTYKPKTDQYNIDYYVLTYRGNTRLSGRRSKGLSELDSLYSKNDPDWSLFIGDRPENYVKVFRSSQ